MDMRLWLQTAAMKGGAPPSRCGSNTSQAKNEYTDKFGLPVRSKRSCTVSTSKAQQHAHCSGVHNADGFHHSAAFTAMAVPRTIH